MAEETKHGQGLASVESRHSVDETVAKIEAILAAKQVKLFVVIDHGGEAAAAGLSMPATMVVVFGNPRGGTPLMLAAPSVAIDLPLKLLVAEDADGVVRIVWNTPDYLEQRHGFPAALKANIAVIEAIARAAAE